MWTFERTRESMGSHATASGWGKKGKKEEDFERVFFIIIQNMYRAVQVSSKSPGCVPEQSQCSNAPNRKRNPQKLAVNLIAPNS